MKKFLFLFLSCIVLGMNGYSQDDFPFDFEPVDGQIYYLKSESPERGLTTSFLADLGGDTITRAAMSPEEAVASGSPAGWKVVLVGENGYTIQNAATNKYMKYIGDYESGATADYQARDMIIPADWNDAEAERYYFSVTIFKERAPYSITANSLTFEIQGYHILAIGSPSNQALDAYGSGMGTYNINSATTIYQSWLFMTEQDVEDFYKVLDESYYTFKPEDGKAYYIKTRSSSHGRANKFVRQAETGDTLSHKSYIDEDVKSDNYAKWYFTFVEKRGYKIQNAETGDFLKYVGGPDGNMRNAIVPAPLIEEDPDYDEDAYIFVLKNDYADLVIGMEKFPDIVPTYITKTYRIINEETNQGMDAWDGAYVSIGTWGSAADKVNHNWMFMTDEDLEPFEKAVNYVPGLTFLSDDPDQIYTIRPNTLWITSWRETDNFDEDEFETKLNARVSVLDNMLQLDIYAPEDPAQQWNIIRATDSTFLFKNVGAPEYGNLEFLAVQKYPASQANFYDALSNVYLADEDPDDINQFLSIQLVGESWIEDEWGKLAQVVAIGNKHILEPEEVDIDNPGRASTPFYLDYWNDGRSFAGDPIACYAHWTNNSYPIMPPAQQFIIRKIEDDMARDPGTNIDDKVIQEPSSRVYSAQGNIVVVLPEGVTESNIRVYTVNGALVESTTKTTIPAAQGFYIVKVGAEAHKVIVK